MKKSVAFAVVSLLVGACSSVGQVQPIGKNTYLVSVHSCSGKLLFGADCKDLGIQTANKYCASHRLVATIMGHRPGGTLGASRKDGHVQFICTDEEHQPAAVLRPDNGVTTVESR